MEGDCLVKRKKKSVDAGFVEFALNKNNTVYMKNVSYLLGRATAIAESNGDTDTLLQIAGAWLEIDSRNQNKRGTKSKKKLPMGFTSVTNSDRMSDLEDEDE